MTGNDHDRISDEARLMAAQVRARARSVPSAAGIASLTVDALGKRPQDMSTDEIRQLVIDALEQSQRVSFYLGRLAGLLGDEGGDPRDQ